MSRIASSTSAPESHTFLGIDVGGTFVKVGIVDRTGKVLAQTVRSTPSLKSPESVFEFACDFAKQQLSLEEQNGFTLAGVGLAVPGVLDSKTTRLREVVNLPGWVDRPLKPILVDVSQKPTIVINDANAAAFAEHSRRQLGKHSLALVTLGTGIGCGVVINGSPHSGDHGCGGELGHIAIRFGDAALPCSCGSRGHLESYAASPGVLNRLHGLYDSNTNGPDLPDWVDEATTTRDIAERAAMGDDDCQHLIDETATYLGQAIGLLGQTIDPAVVLLGGAMTFGGKETATGQRFLRHVTEAMRETTLVQVGRNLIVDFASLGNNAGMVGAALVAQQNVLSESVPFIDSSPNQ